jgi:hypothetical protein
VEEALVNDLRALSLLPFVPSGKDYDGSRRLFAELGFEEIWENGLRMGPGGDLSRPGGRVLARRRAEREMIPYALLQTVSP